MDIAASIVPPSANATFRKSLALSAHAGRRAIRILRGECHARSGGPARGLLGANVSDGMEGWKEMRGRGDLKDRGRFDSSRGYVIAGPRGAVAPTVHARRRALGVGGAGLLLTEPVRAADIVGWASGTTCCAGLLA